MLHWPQEVSTNSRCCLWRGDAQHRAAVTSAAGVAVPHTGDPTRSTLVQAGHSTTHGLQFPLVARTARSSDPPQSRFGLPLGISEPRRPTMVWKFLPLRQTGTAAWILRRTRASTAGSPEDRPVPSSFLRSVRSFRPTTVHTLQHPPDVLAAVACRPTRVEGGNRACTPELSIPDPPGIINNSLTHIVQSTSSTISAQRSFHRLV